MKRSEYHLNWLEAWSEKRKESMAPKKLGAAKKPRVSTRGGSRKNGAESESGAEIVAEVREMIKEMQQVEPDITAGWCANLESTANAITESASLSDWLGTDAAAAQMTLAAAVVDMGQRAPEGRGGLWRNWMRIFAIRVLSKFGLDKDMPEATNLVISRKNRSKTFAWLRQANMICPGPSEIYPAPLLFLSKHTRKFKKRKKRK